MQPDDPSIKSSLTFLRKTPWARDKVESLYGFVLRDIARAQANQKAEWLFKLNQH